MKHQRIRNVPDLESVDAGLVGTLLLIHNAIEHETYSPIFSSQD